jgi:hypothetical protein
VTGAAIIATPPPGIESKYSFVCRFMEDNRLQRLKDISGTCPSHFWMNYYHYYFYCHYLSLLLMVLQV